MRSAAIRLLVPVVLVVPLGFAGNAQRSDASDPDRDGDGLSDFAEQHKHFTAPDKADSDGDGVKDGDPAERREFTYTVEALLRVLPPIDEESLSDDYQDGRVLRRTKEFVEIEVVVYPFNTVASAIAVDPKWRAPSAAAKRWLKPGPTSNFDAAMARDVAAALEKDGIDLEALTDRQAAARVSAWLLKRAQFEDSFTTFAVEYERGKLRVAKGMERRVEEALEKSGRTLEQQWDRELLGKGMYENRIHGTCTSTAIYLQTGLRAAGVPARTIVCIPIVDASDPQERALVDGLSNPFLKQILQASTERLGGSWASHTFNEVLVGGRFRRLNYTRLGQNVLDRDGMGLFVHVNTFDDHAHAGLAPWGLRAAKDSKSDAFGHSNPYSCEKLADRYGAHADRKALAAAEAGFPQLTVTHLYWYADGEDSGIVKMRLDDPDTAGHLVMHVEEGLEGDGTDQFAAFYDRAGKRFALRAEGRADVPASATRGFWIDVAKDVKEFYLRVEPADFARMERGVAYALVYLGGDEACRWIVRDAVTITRAP